MNSFIFGALGTPPSPSMSSSSTTSSESDMSLSSLPDELLSMCYSGLDAADLVMLQLVSRRMRDLVAGDDVIWRECSKKEWENSQSMDLMSMAAVSAGGWKQLYAAKKFVDSANRPWSVPSEHEVNAILELIKGGTRACNATKATGEYGGATSSSPRSVLGGIPGPSDALSVVLLVDGSSSVTEVDFDVQKSFCRQVVRSISRTHPNASVAVIQFNQYPKVHAGLTSVSEPRILNAIENMQQMMGSTDIAAPIRRARQMLAEDGVEVGEKAIVILTDGQTHSDELRDAEAEAKQAAVDLGARLFALGVGRDVDENGLRRVARGTNDVISSSQNMSNGAYFPLRKMHRTP